MEAPALRISNIVMGRQLNGPRVSYLLSPDGTGEQRAAPETVVLRRWRQRQMKGHTFAGSRLSSTVWRAVAFAFGDSPQQIEAMTEQDLERHIEGHRDAMKKRHLSLPSAAILKTLASDLGPDRLRQLVERHTADSRRGMSGVPDLYLYARAETATGKPAFSRFVEVKKPSERILPDQNDEIAFMQSLGLRARVLRLIERG